MKSKISLLVVVIFIFNSTFSYCDYMYIPYSNDYSIQNKSGTVAVGGAIASSVIALATKVGIEFATNEDMHKFIVEMVSDARGVDVLNDIADVVTYAGAGVLSIPAGIVNAFCNYVNGKKLSSSSYASLNFKNSDGVSFSIPVLPFKFNNTSLYGNAGISLLKQIGESVGTDISTVFRNNGINATKVIRLPNLSIGFKNRGSDVLFASGGVDATFDITNSFSGYTRDWSSSYSRVKCFIVGVATSSNSDYELKLGYVFYSPVTGIQNGNAGVISLPYGRYFFRDIIGNGTDFVEPFIPSDIIDSPGSSVIPVPSNPSDLVGKTPSDITDSPSYDVWNPGSVVVPPVSDSTDVIYTPDLSVPGSPVYIPGDDSGTDSPGDDSGTDSPGDDSGTDNPGDSSLWDWLKALLQKILDLIQAIVDWITGFWDKFVEIMKSIFSFEWLGEILSSILEFIQNIVDWISDFWVNLFEFVKSLFVPSENYFVDKFDSILSSIRSRIPGIDIERLKKLAVGERKFEDFYATFFGVKCLVVRGSVVNNVVGWSKPIIQGLIAIFLLLYNYNQIYKLIRGGSVVGSSRSSDERGK